MRTILITAGAGILLVGGIALWADDDRYEHEKELTKAIYDLSMQDKYLHKEKVNEKDEDEAYTYQKKRASYQNTQQGNMPKDHRALELYVNECGACHMAYQPEFLPKRSWKKMMATLEDHFDTDASLDKNETAAIKAYLMRNASDAKRTYGEFREISEGIRADETPLRISETRYFKKEHRKIPKDLITQKEVKSIANCSACHTKAQEGDYSERMIRIPNYGRWDD